MVLTNMVYGQTNNSIITQVKITLVNSESFKLKSININTIPGIKKDTVKINVKFSATNTYGGRVDEDFVMYYFKNNNTFYMVMPAAEYWFYYTKVSSGSVYKYSDLLLYKMFPNLEDEISEEKKRKINRIIRAQQHIKDSITRHISDSIWVSEKPIRDSIRLVQHIKDSITRHISDSITLVEHIKDSITRNILKRMCHISDSITLVQHIIDERNIIRSEHIWSGLSYIGGPMTPVGFGIMFLNQNGNNTTVEFVFRTSAMLNKDAPIGQEVGWGDHIVYGYEYMGNKKTAYDMSTYVCHPINDGSKINILLGAGIGIENNWNQYNNKGSYVYEDVFGGGVRINLSIGMSATILKNISLRVDYNTMYNGFTFGLGFIRIK